MTETRQIVVPGEEVGTTESHAPGQNTYLEGRSIRALRLGVKSVRGDRVNVISLNGRYEPARGDMVIGTIVEMGPSNWYINIGAANDVGMHVNDVPWRVEFGETSKYLDIGETVLLKIVYVDEMKKAQVTMKDRQCRKLTGGLIWEVSPTKVPRIVGRNGSMISLIKDYTNVRVFVGQNGIVWLDGEAADVSLALEALQKIEAEAHTTGLTDRMKAFFEERRPGAAERKRASEAPDEEHPVEAGEEFRPRRERRERPRVEREPEADVDLERDRQERRERSGGRDAPRDAPRDGPRDAPREGPRHERHHSERRAEHHGPHQGREQMRERAERPAAEARAERPPRRMDERDDRRGGRPEGGDARGPRRFEDAPPRREMRDEPRREMREEPRREMREEPRREMREEPRGGMRSMRDEPRREMRDEPRREMRDEPRRGREEERPRGAERPPRRFEQERAPPRFDDARGSREPAAGGQFGERPARRFEEERAPKGRFEERVPPPKPRFDDQERPLRRSRLDEPQGSPARGSRPAFDDQAEERPARRPRFSDAPEGSSSRSSRSGGDVPAGPSSRGSRFGGDAPAGPSSRSSRFGDDEEETAPPARRAVEDAPPRAPRRFDDEPVARRGRMDDDAPVARRPRVDDDIAPARRTRVDDDEEEDEAPVRREGGDGESKRRRRGGRGRGRGGRGERSD